MTDNKNLNKIDKRMYSSTNKIQINYNNKIQKNYNLVLVTSWCILQQTNVSTPDLSPLQCRYKYYKDLTSQIGPLHKVKL